jgi:hypothetical protein
MQQIKNTLIENKFDRYFFETRSKLWRTFERTGFFFRRTKPNSKDAIILVGSGRSGTTWIQNSLAKNTKHQPIFEPLNPNFIEPARKLLATTPMNEPLVYSPYLRADDDYPYWYEFLNNFLSGNIRNYWTDKQNFSLFPRGYIIKLIRANLMLGYLIKNFKPRLIYIMRHPCAVVSSRLKLKWQVSLSGLYTQPKLLEDYLTPFLSDIEKETNPIGIHAIWWAIENYVALKELQGNEYFFVHYEDVCLNPREWFSGIEDWLGLVTNRKEDVPIFHQADKDHQDKTMRTRLNSWKTEMSPEQIRLTLKWANIFGLDYYSPNLTRPRSEN